MSLETLYPEVTEAIMDAQELRARGDPGTKEAYRKVSRLEEEIAKIVPASDLEGGIARRGAVRAALRAGDKDRAADLAGKYAPEADEALRDDLRKLLKKGGFDEPAIARAIAANMPSLAERLFPVEIGADERLYPAPAQLADDSAVTEGDVAALYAELRRVLAELLALMVARGDGASRRYIDMLDTAQNAAPSSIETCKPPVLNRALHRLLAAAARGKRNNDFDATEITLIDHVHHFFEILPTIFPALGEYRRASSFDGFVSPPASVKQEIVAILVTAATDRSIVGHELAIELSRREIAVIEAAEVGELAPDREQVWEAADALFSANMQIETLEKISEEQTGRGENWLTFRRRVTRTTTVRQWSQSAWAG